jgi:hypothetical protein
MISIQLYFLGFISLVLTFSLGYLSLRAITNLSVKECLAFAGGWGCALQGAIAFLGFTVGVSERNFFLSVSLGLFILFLGLLFWQKYPIGLSESLNRNRSIIEIFFEKINYISKILLPASYFQKNTSRLYVLLIYWLTLASIQLCMPIYSGSDWYGDWWLHYDVAQFYLGEKAGDTIYFGIYTVTSRTPLFNLFISYYLGIFGNGFSIYQLAATLPGIFLLTTIPLFLRSRKVILAMILMALNPYMNHMTIFPWPKILTSIYIIAGIYFYLKIRKEVKSPWFNRSRLYCGISLGLAILGHPSALIYVVAIAVDSLWLNRGNIQTIIRQLTIPLSSAFAVLLPWIMWGINRYGIVEFFHNSAKTTGTAPITARIIDTLKNATYTMEPHRLLNELFNIDPARTKIGAWDSWLLLYYDVLPGTLTLTMSVLLIATVINRYLNKRRLQLILPHSFFVIIVIVGFWGGCILQPGPNPGGIVGESMTPIFYFLMLVVTEYLYTLPIKVKRLLLLISFGEFLLSFGLHMSFMAMDSSIVWDSNLNLKFNNDLLFARDLTKTAWPIFVGAIGFLLLLAIGFKNPLNAENGYIPSLPKKAIE